MIKVCEKYNDIINLKHSTSKKYPRMSIYKRSSQFAPFAALTGFGFLINEESRITSDKRVLTNEEKILIGDKLRFIEDNLLCKSEVNFVYFIFDKRKRGGRYINKKGIVKKIDLFNRKVIFKDGAKINIDDIMDVSFMNL